MIVSGAYLFSVNIVDANPTQIEREKSSPNGSSTLSYIGKGLATTTDEYDTQEDRVYPADSAAFMVLMTGSSTDSKLIIEFERSQDGDDWYRDSYSVSTTSDEVAGEITKSIRMRFSSSTPVFAGSDGLDRMYRIFNVPTPTRYIRAVISGDSGSTTDIGLGNSGFYTEWIGKRQLR